MKSTIYDAMSELVLAACAYHDHDWDTDPGRKIERLDIAIGAVRSSIAALRDDERIGPRMQTWARRLRTVEGILKRKGKA